MTDGAPPDGSPPDGIVVVDKPAGWTSHDVVARVRRTLGTRKVGHAGTLDPMATGVLVLGVGRATRLLGHLMLAEKTYEATVRLGASTTTDDAEGEVVSTAPAATITSDDVERVLNTLVGEIEQVPSSVSAIKIDGKRAYARVRAGEDVVLEPRRVTVHRLEATDFRPVDDALDFDLRIRCSSGTYIRAIARDAGDLLGVGGHLTRLRRSSVGPFSLDTTDTDLDHLTLLPLGEVASQCFPVLELEADPARDVLFGRPLTDVALPGDGPVAVFGPDGTFLALYERRGSGARPIAVFAQP